MSNNDLHYQDWVNSSNNRSIKIESFNDVIARQAAEINTLREQLSNARIDKQWEYKITVGGGYRHIIYEVDRSFSEKNIVFSSESLDKMIDHFNNKIQDLNATVCAMRNLIEDIYHDSGNLNLPDEIVKRLGELR